MVLHKVARKSDIQENKGKEVKVDNTRIAIFYTDGKYYALDALCRHQDGSLAPGRVDGEIVECPLHSWHYNVRTGELLDYVKGVKLATYEVIIKGNDLYLDM
jgi:3-phenylpropionate/trans-cinnamate dioxygenase ferredoxin component